MVKANAAQSRVDGEMESPLKLEADRAPGRGVGFSQVSP